jgi:two-component system nitrate/nitrite response regulator NarL
MKLVLCDDQQILCEALAAALAERHHQVLAVTTTVAAGVTAVAVHDPDICLLDVHFPGAEDGLDVAREIAERHPATKVLVLSGVADPQILSEAMGIGAAGFIPKDQSIDQISAALDVIAAGGAVFDAGLSGGAPPPRREQRSTHLLGTLTPREREILARIVDGQSTRQMARAMGITTGTASMYVRNVLTKLGVHSRLQAAALATREGLLDQHRHDETGRRHQGRVTRLSCQVAQLCQGRRASFAPDGDTRRRPGSTWLSWTGSALSPTPSRHGWKPRPLPRL